ncbi:monocarboxylate transporter 12-like [Glandiceps talaboti]
MEEHEMPADTPPPPPPDGGYGWVVAIAGMVIVMMIGGMTTTGGIFLVEFVEYFEAGAAQASLIGSICVAVLDCSGPPAAILTSKFGSRVVIMAGGVLSTTGIVLSTFAPSLAFLYFTYGILVGFGFGLMFVSGIIHISKYFKKKFAIANGLYYSGSGIGVIGLAPLLHYLIEVYGWKGAMLIVGGINANVLVCGALMRPLNNVKRATKSLPRKQRYVQTQKVYKPITANHIDGTSHLINNTTLSSEHKCNVDSEINSVNMSEQACKNTENRECQKQKKSWKQKVGSGISQLRLQLFVENPTLSIICVAQFLEGFGFMITLSFLVSRAISSGITKLNADLLLTVYGGVGFVARLCHGVIIDMKIVSPTRLLGLGVGMFGVAALTSPLTNVYGVLAVMVGVMGLCSGVYQSLVPVAIRECVGDTDMGTAVGWDLFLMGIGSLLGPPAAGLLYDRSGNYSSVFFLSGGTMITSGLLIFFSPYAKSRRTDLQPDLDNVTKINDDRTSVISYDFPVSSV